MEMTNREFSKKNEAFLKACEAVARMIGFSDFKPSARQASKWRNNKGIAYKVARGIPVLARIK